MDSFHQNVNIFRLKENIFQRECHHWTPPTVVFDPKLELDIGNYYWTDTTLIFKAETRMMYFMIQYKYQQYGSLYKNI